MGSRRTTMTDDAGHYVFYLAPGLYSVRFDHGFYRASAVENVRVSPGAESEVDMTMEFVPLPPEGHFVTGVPVPMETPRIPSVWKLEKTTPRLRPSFPEALAWEPYLETDAEGHASWSFPLANQNAMWKLSVMASSADGRVGFADCEIHSFQPLSVDFDLPKVLTEGDEISPPVLLRNHLDRPLSVDLEIAPAASLRFMDSSSGRVAISSLGLAREVFRIRALAPSKEAGIRVSVGSNEASDDIAKSSLVRTNGREFVHTTLTLLKEATSIKANFPGSALADTRQAELRIYPSLMAHAIESVSAVMKLPDGGAEAIISSGYPSLLLLKYLEQYEGPSAARTALSTKARRQVKVAYDNILGFRQATGGFSWGSKRSDVALTAYVLRFIEGARDVIKVDKKVLFDAKAWLLANQEENGHWKWSGGSGAKDGERSLSLTALVTRVLATQDRLAARRALRYISKRMDDIDEPYTLANSTLAALELGDHETAGRGVTRLQGLARTEVGKTFWRLQERSPFYGWGLAGRIEATALAVQALFSASEAGIPVDVDLIRQGLIFLLESKDRDGVWHTTQATALTVESLLILHASLSREPMSPGSIDVLVNGKLETTMPLPEPDLLANPIHLDLTTALASNANIVEVHGNVGNDATVELTTVYHRPWMSHAPSESDGPLHLSVSFDKTVAGIGEPVTCKVRVEHTGLHEPGMMIAEIGLPPGVDVERASLERVFPDYSEGLFRYEILPDHLLVTMWNQEGGSQFEFTFRPQLEIRAQSAPSILWDYYNPETRVDVPPVRFVVLPKDRIVPP